MGMPAHPARRTQTLNHLFDHATSPHDIRASPGTNAELQAKKDLRVQMLSGSKEYLSHESLTVLAAALGERFML